jgi:DNA-binding response OmpR family regulator
MSKSILIVDDEFGLADVVAEILGESGYETAIAINGRLGLAALAEKRIDLVLLDVMMPVLNGPAMLEAMRRDTAYAEVPVVFMTALAEAVPRNATARHQAVLIKPFAANVLLATVKRLIGGPA